MNRKLSMDALFVLVAMGLVFALFSIVSCKKEIAIITVQSVSLSETSLELIVGDQASLDATITPENATDKSVKWSSSNEAIATVSDAGLVKALMAGSAVITATTNDGNKTASCSVSVDHKVEELKVLVSLNDATNITAVDAIIGGTLNIEPEGTFTTSVELYYSCSATTLSALKASSTAKTLSLASNGSFSYHLSGLHYSTDYYYAVIAKVDDKEFTSEVKSFTTKSIVVPDLVDLGLSVKWGSFNLGASAPEDYGLYYQWGDIQGYGSDTSDGMYFNWATYKWCNGSEISLTKYNTKLNYGTVDDKTVLDTEDDAARDALGGKWRVPTDEEWTEIRNTDNCSWTWTTINDVNGYKVQSLNAGHTDKWIFLPAAGCRYNNSLNKVGTSGYYWSSSLRSNAPSYAIGVNFDADGIFPSDIGRYIVRPIRPVSN